MKVRSLVIGALGLALGAIVGLAVAGERPAPAQASAKVAIAAPAPLGRADIAAVVRAELARRPVATGAPTLVAPTAIGERASAANAASVAGEGGADGEPAPEVVERSLRAADVLDGALARGTWTDTDAAALREQLATLPAAQAMPIMIRMGEAINHGELAVVTDGMPL